MRVNDNPSLPEGFFAGDLPDGGTKLECGNCKHIFENKILVINTETSCPNCKKELFYRSWWEW